MVFSEKNYIFALWLRFKVSLVKSVRVKGLHSFSSTPVFKQFRMERIELIEVYKRYTKGLKETNVPIDIVTWNSKLTNVLVDYYEEHPGEKDVYQSLIYGSLRSAVHYINRFNVRLKDLPNARWNGDAVNRGCKLIKSLCRAMGYFKDAEMDATAMRTSLANFINLCKEMRSTPAVRLYLWVIYNGKVNHEASLLESSIFIKYAKELTSNPQLKESLDEFEARLNKAFNPANVVQIIEAYASSPTE